MTVTDPGLIDWRERTYVSQFSAPALTLLTYIGGVLADPDGSAVAGQLVLGNPDGTVTGLGSAAATREGSGTYVITPTSAQTQYVGYAELDWSYAIGGVPQQYASYLEIGPANPSWDALPPAMQDFLEAQVWSRFRDAFDSAGGGPNLQSYFQAHWSRGRMAQMAAIALSKINASAQPWSNYTLDGISGPMYPVALWGGLLASWSYTECCRQLVRSYTEQPMMSGPPVARLDRRDYADRWRQVIKDEEADLKGLLDVFKIRHIMAGNPRVLVSGGSYGRYAPTRIAGSVAARPRMWARWRPGTDRSCPGRQHGKIEGCQMPTSLPALRCMQPSPSPSRPIPSWPLAACASCRSRAAPCTARCAMRRPGTGGSATAGTARAAALSGPRWTAASG